MTSRAERARLRAAWRARREHQLAEALYLARGAIQELEADGRWTPGKAGELDARIETLARMAGVFDAYNALVQP